MHIELIGNYHLDGQESMERFAVMLARGFRDQGHIVEIWKPKAVLGTIARTTKYGIGKWLGYLDKCLLYPLMQSWRTQIKKQYDKEVRFHICDHSISPYLKHLPREQTIITCNDVLAIRAPSWGPDNCFAYLKKYGNFGSNQILLIVSSHDAYDNMTFDKVVGAHVNYPKEQYQFAISELIERYLYPRYLEDLIIARKVRNSDANKLAINKYKEGMNFNSGFEKFKNYSDSTGVPLLIYFHAERSERETGEYNSQGQLIINFCKNNSIPLVQELDYSFPEDAYLDNIHMSEKGHYLMFKILKDVLNGTAVI